MVRTNRAGRAASRACARACVVAMAITAACGPSSIRVVGVMQRSTEMRPLPSVPLGGYQGLHLLVRAAEGQESQKYGSPDCGYTTLEGSEEGDRRNAACVPTEALNTAIGLVRQRLRSYGITVARDAAEAYDYTVEVSVTGEAPRQPDRAQFKAVERLTFKVHDGPLKKLVSGMDRGSVTAAFDAASRNCGLPHATFEEFSGVGKQPMTPDFDIVGLSSDAVDGILRCYDLANFFLTARGEPSKS